MGVKKKKSENRKAHVNIEGITADMRREHKSDEKFSGRGFYTPRKRNFYAFVSALALSALVICSRNIFLDALWFVDYQQFSAQEQIVVALPPEGRPEPESPLPNS